MRPSLLTAGCVCLLGIFLAGCGNRENGPDGQLRQAQHDLQARDYQQAMAHVTKALNLRPGYGPAYLLRAQVHEAQGLLAMALDDYTRALDSPEERGEALRRSGDLFRRLGRYAQAISSYEQLIHDDPQEVEGYLGRAGVLIKQKRYEPAREDLRHAERIRPDDSRIAAALGQFFEAQGEFPRALLEYERAVALDKQSVDARILLGTLHARENRIEEGLAAYGTVLQMDPGRGDVYYKRSFLHLAAGNYGQALDDTVRARFLGEEVDAAYVSRLKQQAQERAAEGGP
ncbi:MAG: tetratricopeptide repeat protein [Candidatus Omnitrophica bacterium]|nr:tetratricopeptide repeat protein [Candidatus Omnitrophota bacterium]